MYRVRIECSGEVLEIMETDQMTSSAVYKSVLSDIKWHAFMDLPLKSYDTYSGYVYKNGKLAYLLSFTRIRDLKWTAITRSSDLKTCVIRSFN